MISEWMDRFVEFESTWLWMLLLATWRTLPILVLVSGIGLALRRKITPSLHALLLTIIVVRLLVPISIGSRLSLHQPIDNWFSSIGEPGESAEGNQPRIARAHQYALLPNLDQVEVQTTPWRPPAQVSRAIEYEVEELFFAAIVCMLIAVSMGLVFRSILSHVRFAFRLQSCRLVDDPSFIDLLLRECDSLAVGRRPEVREVPWLAAPAVFGLFRKTICFPSRLTESLCEQELRWVIRHELAHIRRRDIPTLMIASLATAFHWFNPVVWLVVRRLRAAMEAASDRLAVQSLSASEVTAYGKLLLRFAEDSIVANKSPTLGLISFASGKHLQHRVELLLRGSKPSGLTVNFLSASLVGAIALVGLTDARKATERKMPELHLVENDSFDLKAQPLRNAPFGEQEPGAPTFVESYDVTSIFESMPESFKRTEKSPLEQLASWLPMPIPLSEKLRIDGLTLSAELTASQHQLLKQTIEIWKNGEPKQISIEARFIQTDINTASSIKWAERRIDGLTVRGLGPAIAARITEPELAKLVRTVSADRRGNIVFAPKVTLFDGQTAGITDQVQRPFVTGVDPKADGRMQPVVSVVAEGLSFILTPKAGENDSVTLAFEVKASSVGKVSYANLPLRTSNTGEPPFTVQVPATEQYEVSSSVKLSAGESVVVAIPRVFSNEPGADAETTVIVALTPRIIDVQKSFANSGSNEQ